MGTAESWAGRPSDVRGAGIRQMRGPESRHKVQTLADWEEISNVIRNTETAAKEVLWDEGGRRGSNTPTSWFDKMVSAMQSGTTEIWQIIWIR